MVETKPEEVGRPEPRRDLTEILNRVGAVLEEAADPGALCAEVRRARPVLAARFAFEEREPYLGSAVATRPRLDSRAHELLAQHEELLATFAVFCTREPAHMSPEEWSSLAARFARFRDRLDRHEAGEDALLLGAVQTDLGAAD